jgi:tetratricopeptide (TPR) repeat protein
MRSLARWAPLAAAALALVTLVACSSAPPAAPVHPAPDPGLNQGLVAGARAFLLDPLAGYPLGLDEGRSAALSAAHRRMLADGLAEAAGREAARMLEVDPALAPAIVLLAESELLRGRAQDAAERLQPVVRLYPDYLAALLTLGRAEESLSRVVEAYAAYRQALATAAATALEPSRLAPVEATVAALEPRAVEIVGQRLGDALERGRVEQAQQELDRLRNWAPDAEVTLDGWRAVARALEDPVQELAALARLSELRPDDLELTMRRAGLELEVGSAAQGRMIFQRLAEQYPDDPEISDGLQRAQFRWRLEMLPEEVRSLASVRPELNRAQFASLLYWLVPEVRYGRPQTARIASDILDHPLRQQIARVVNLDLMAIDPTRHYFYPERAIQRGAALRALLMMLGSAEPVAACLADRRLDQSSAAPAICASAARCRLLHDVADCLPEGPLAGPEAVEMIRRAVEQR